MEKLKISGGDSFSDSIGSNTRQVPRICAANVEIGDDGGGQRGGEDLAFEVLKNQFLISWVETKPGREFDYSIAEKVELLLHIFLKLMTRLMCEL